MASVDANTSTWPAFGFGGIFHSLWKTIPEPVEGASSLTSMRGAIAMPGHTGGVVTGKGPSMAAMVSKTIYMRENLPIGEFALPGIVLCRYVELGQRQKVLESAQEQSTQGSFRR